MKEGNVFKFTISSNDVVCGSGGAISDGCLEFASLSRELSVYPLGKKTSIAAVWATAGTDYAMEFEDDAF